MAYLGSLPLGPSLVVCNIRKFCRKIVVFGTHCGQWRIYHWAMAPLCKKMQPKCAIFRQNINDFLGRGIPLPRRHLHWGGKYPWPDPSPLGVCGSDAVIDEFGKANRRLVLLIDLGLLNGTRLEVGPANIQSSVFILNKLAYAVRDGLMYTSKLHYQHTRFSYHVRHLHA